MIGYVLRLKINVSTQLAAIVYPMAWHVTLGAYIKLLLVLLWFILPEIAALLYNYARIHSVKHECNFVKDTPVNVFILLYLYILTIAVIPFECL